MYAYYRSGIELIKCSSDCLQLKNCKKNVKIVALLGTGYTMVVRLLKNIYMKLHMYVCMYVHHSCMYHVHTAVH